MVLFLEYIYAMVKVDMEWLCGPRTTQLRRTGATATKHDDLMDVNSNNSEVKKIKHSHVGLAYTKIN